MVMKRQCHLGVVADRLVLGVADAGGEVAEEQRLSEDEVVVVVLEALLDGVVLDLVVEVDVALLDQLVAVDAVALVNPQTDQIRRVLAAFRRRKQHSLHNNAVHATARPACSGVKLNFHGTDTDTDTDILAEVGVSAATSPFSLR